MQVEVSGNSRIPLNMDCPVTDGLEYSHERLVAPAGAEFNVAPCEGSQGSLLPGWTQSSVADVYALLVDVHQCSSGKTLQYINSIIILGYIFASFLLKAFQQVTLLWFIFSSVNTLCISIGSLERIKPIGVSHAVDI